MSLGPIVLVVYGMLMILGGLMGARAGSRVSLVAGAGSGVLLLVAWGITRSNMSAGLWMGELISLLLAVTFGARLARTRKVMPAGVLLVTSVIAFLLLLYAAMRG